MEYRKLWRKLTELALLCSNSGEGVGHGLAWEGGGC